MQVSPQKIWKARKDRGRVVVDAAVAEGGSVEAVKVVAGDPLVSAAVVEAVKKWKFRSSAAPAAG